MKAIIKIMFMMSLCVIANTYAQQVNIRPFEKGSYQQILRQYKDQPLVLILWSMTCSSCLSEMPLIQKIHQQNPRLNMVMISVDGPEFYQEMWQIIKREKLSTIEHWGFAEDNSPALRYIIDGSWYGELPRTYFFDKQHHKAGISGVLSLQQYEVKISDIAPR